MELLSAAHIFFYRVGEFQEPFLGRRRWQASGSNPRWLQPNSGVHMKSAITKRSVVIGGHKTSVSLEEPFWSAVREIAGNQQMTVSSLLRQIDLERRNANLSSAIRVFVLENMRSQGVGHQQPHANGGAIWRPSV
jgi:predicted DNA-binding ribbon-helix-helix protein